MNTDKMIMKEVDILPHGLINNVEDKLGDQGQILKEYVKWLKERIIHLRKNESYAPILHIDVYGTMGLAFDNGHIVMPRGVVADSHNIGLQF
jgi:methylaspartate ammonia-lyase